ncbi:MAG: flagellar basal body rod protein FlgC [bacterium]
MSLFNTIDTAASGMTAERMRMDVISDNLANANTTRTEDGGPYMRKVVRLEPRQDEKSGMLPDVSIDGFSSQHPGNGVRVVGIEQAEGKPRRVFRPNHPDANEEGYLKMPNVEPTKEMVDMITASRAFTANTKAIKTAKGMFNQALQIMR